MYFLYFCRHPAPPPHNYMQTHDMESTGFLLHSLITSPVETLEMLEMCCAESCDLVAMDVSSAIATVKLAHAAGVRQCGASVQTATKSIAAVREGFGNVAAALNAAASLCASAMAFEDVEAVKAAVEEGRRGRQLLQNLQAVSHQHWVSEMEDVGGLETHFKQLLDLPTLNDCELVCQVDKDKPNRAARLPRGRHSFTLHINVMVCPERSEGCEEEQFVALFPLLPDDVVVNIRGDATATWACTQHPDEFGVVVDYTASPEPDSVEITAHVLESFVCNQTLVNSLVCFVCVYAVALWASA